MPATLRISKTSKKNQTIILKKEISWIWSFWLTLFKKYTIDGVIHLAAESHVDRSLHNPTEFANTNIIGTLNASQSCTDCLAQQL